MAIEIHGQISKVQTIATGSKIHELARLKKVYGPGRWRKRKGVAKVGLPDGTIVLAEVHWYEAHGSARRSLRLRGC